MAATGEKKGKVILAYSGGLGELDSSPAHALLSY